MRASRTSAKTSEVPKHMRFNQLPVNRPAIGQQLCVFEIVLALSSESLDGDTPIDDQLAVVAQIPLAVGATRKAAP